MMFDQFTDEEVLSLIEADEEVACEFCGHSLNEETEAFRVISEGDLEEVSEEFPLLCCGDCFVGLALEARSATLPKEDLS